MYPSSTSSSERSLDDRREAFRLLLRLAMFALPLVSFLLAAELVLVRTGDSWPVERVVSAQEKDPTLLFGRGYLAQQFNLYKLETLRRRAPRLLVAGSSRVLQLRDLHFRPLDGLFYNAGGALQGLEDLVVLGDLLAEGGLPLPETLIVGIDPWWLRSDATLRSWLSEKDLRDAALRPQGHLAAILQLARGHRIPLRALLHGAGGESPHLGLPAVGSLALEQGNGFRHDGSRQYSPRILVEYLKNPVFVDREEPPVIERIRKGTHQFAGRPVLDPVRLDRLVSALAALDDRGIEVVAWLPTFSDESARALEESPELSSWWRDYRVLVPSTLAEKGIACVPHLTPSALGLDDRYLFDGYHPSEVLLTRVVPLIVAASDRGSLLRSVDLEGLKKLLENERVIPLAFEAPGRRD